MKTRPKNRHKDLGARLSTPPAISLAARLGDGTNNLNNPRPTNAAWRYPLGTKKIYTFAHDADVGVLVNELQKDLTQQARKNGMTLDHQGRRFRIHGSGVDINVAVTTTSLHVTLELGWLAEMVRGRIEAGINDGVPTLLRRAEQLSRTARARRS